MCSCWEVGPGQPIIQQQCVSPHVMPDTLRWRDEARRQWRRGVGRRSGSSGGARRQAARRRGDMAMAVRRRFPLGAASRRLEAARGSGRRSCRPAVDSRCGEGSGEAVGAASLRLEAARRGPLGKRRHPHVGRSRPADVPSARRRRQVMLVGHQARVFNLAFHPVCPNLLASGSDDKTIRIWNCDPAYQALPPPMQCAPACFGLPRDGDPREEWRSPVH